MMMMMMMMMMVVVVVMVQQEEASCRILFWRPLIGGQKEGLYHDIHQHLSGHEYQVVDMVVVDDEDMLVTGDVSGEVRLWDIISATITQVRTLTGMLPITTTSYHP